MYTAPPTLRFVRHGATLANLAGLRCGGDLDLPLTDQGRAQAQAVASRIALLEPAVGLVITSDLQRTRETAAIIAASLPGVPVVIEPAFAERRLGTWNLRAIDETQPWLDARRTPPGGESDVDFADRIADALRGIERHLARRPLVVGSKGVARVLGELLGLPERIDLANGSLIEFDLAAQACCMSTDGNVS